MTLKFLTSSVKPVLFINTILHLSAICFLRIIICRLSAEAPNKGIDEDHILTLHISSVQHISIIVIQTEWFYIFVFSIYCVITAVTLLDVSFVHYTTLKAIKYLAYLIRKRSLALASLAYSGSQWGRTQLNWSFHDVTVEIRVKRALKEN